jgi:hypothetical protein
MQNMQNLNSELFCILQICVCKRLYIFFCIFCIFKLFYIFYCIFYILNNIFCISYSIFRILKTLQCDTATSQ